MSQGSHQCQVFGPGVGNSLGTSGRGLKRCALKSRRCHVCPGHLTQMLGQMYSISDVQVLDLTPSVEASSDVL